MGIAVREPQERDREAWRALWSGYLEFYETDPDDVITDATWARLLDDDPDIGAFLAVGPGDEPIGLVHYVAHATTWDTRPVGYLQDLFVHPSHRGRGTGRALIERVIQLGRNREWSELYWITAADNEPARRLYRVLAVETDWVQYEVDLSGDGTDGDAPPAPR